MACAPAATAGLPGFDAAQSAAERRLEARFLPVPSAGGALADARFINSAAHYAGTPSDYRLAVYMRDRLRSYGFDADLEPAKVRIDTVQTLALQLLGRLRTVTFDLREMPERKDADGSRPDAGIPFNYGSADGDVRAPLVYASRGLDRDYATLSRAGVSVRGALVLVRYGAQFRGLLAMRAQQHGAAGVVFYSDPQDDGFARGPTYPDGPWRPVGAVQRGAMSPGLRIPTLPVTALTAKALLAAMIGRPGPHGWSGALGVRYVLGRTRSGVHLVVKLRRRQGTIWNTVGRLKGSDPSEMVILGGHRDAWVYGVTDNGSGITTLLQAAHGLGDLHAHGWTPRRTIVIAGWDAEEIGELGSRAFARAHAQALKRQCVAYINADENVAGPLFGADAAAALAEGVVGATRAVAAPDGRAAGGGGTGGGRGVSVYDRWRAQSLHPAPARPGRVARLVTGAPWPDTPGGGSDHEVFLFDLGIPTAQVGFGGPLGVYHSAYDDLRFATTIADPGFQRHRAAARLLGVLTLRLANAPAAPYRFEAYAAALQAGVRAIDARQSAGVDEPGLRALRSSIGRFLAAAARFDAAHKSAGARTSYAAARSGRPSGDDDRALAAVQLIDTAVYGAVGYSQSAFPKIAAALKANDRAAIVAGLKSTTAQIDRATGLLEGRG